MTKKVQKKFYELDTPEKLSDAFDSHKRPLERTDELFRLSFSEQYDELLRFSLLKEYLKYLCKKVDGAVWNEQGNCYMYTWGQAQKAVPEGFHLPSAREFMELCIACGYLEKSDEEVVKKLQDLCGFVMAGFTGLDDKIYSYSRSGSYWSSTCRDVDAAYHLYFDIDTVDPAKPTNEFDMYAVRCIKNDGKEK